MTIQPDFFATTGLEWLDSLLAEDKRRTAIRGVVGLIESHARGAAS